MPSPSALTGSGISTSGGISQLSSGVSPTTGSSVPGGTAAGTAHDGLAATCSPRVAALWPREARPG